MYIIFNFRTMDYIRIINNFNSKIIHKIIYKIINKITNKIIYKITNKTIFNIIIMKYLQLDKINLVHKKTMKYSNKTRILITAINNIISKITNKEVNNKVC